MRRLMHSLRPSRPTQGGRVRLRADDAVATSPFEAEGIPCRRRCGATAQFVAEGVDRLGPARPDDLAGNFSAAHRARGACPTTRIETGRWPETRRRPVNLPAGGRSAIGWEKGTERINSTRFGGRPPGDGKRHAPDGVLRSNGRLTVMPRLSFRRRYRSVPNGTVIATTRKWSALALVPCRSPESRSANLILQEDTSQARAIPSTARCALVRHTQGHSEYGQERAGVEIVMWCV